jgi:hypothetical protein
MKLHFANLSGIGRDSARVVGRDDDIAVAHFLSGSQNDARPDHAVVPDFGFLVEHRCDVAMWLALKSIYFEYQKGYVPRLSITFLSPILLAFTTTIIYKLLDFSILQS